VLVVVAIQHTASLAVLAPVAALIGAGEGLFLPASFTIIPSIVEPEQLQVANSISTALTAWPRAAPRPRAVRLTMAIRPLLPVRMLPAVLFPYEAAHRGY
jgi:hypothetical protein